MSIAVTVLVGVGSVILGRMRRHRGRTRDQASTIFTLRTAIVALVQTSTQGWTAVDGSVRPTVVSQLPLIQDSELRQLANELLETTRQLAAAGNAEAGAGLRDEVDDLHERFRWRSNEVVRQLNLGRVPRGN